LVQGTVVGAAPAPPQADNKELKNDEGVAVKLGDNKFAYIAGMDGSKSFYCGRDVGYDVLGDDSDGTCGKMGGPHGGPQCPSCQRFQASQPTATEENPNLAESNEVAANTSPAFPAHEGSTIARDDSNLTRSASRLEVLAQKSSEMAQRNPVKFNVMRVCVPLGLIVLCIFHIIMGLVGDEPFHENFFSFLSFTAASMVLCLAVVVLITRMLFQTASSGNDSPVRQLLAMHSKLIFVVPGVGIIGFLWGVMKFANPGASYHADCGDWTPRPP